MRILIAAGEVSGDRFAAGLASSLAVLCPDVRIIGIGSEALAAAGADLRLDLTTTASIGLTEALPCLFRSLFYLRRAKQLLETEKPDLFIPVDCQGYNLKLARYARKLGVPVVYFIPPQIFFWNDTKRGRAIVPLCGLIVSIYRQGYEFYSALGAKVVFVGHPLLDEMGAAVALLEDIAGKRCIALVPGTRKQEIKRLLPVLLETASGLHAEDEGLLFIIPAANQTHQQQLERRLRGCSLPVRIVAATAGAVLPHCELYIGKSGTVSLEAALARVPALLVYRLSRISYFLLARITGLAKKIRFIGLPNLLLNKEVVPEFLQKQARAELLIRKAKELLYNNKTREAQLSALAAVRRLSGEAGVLERVARAVLEFGEEAGGQ